MMTRSLPSVCMCFFWSTLNPRPRPTRMITDAIPHTIPNIVRKARILWARKVENAWRRISERVMGALKGFRLPALCFRYSEKRLNRKPDSGSREPALLQHYLIAFFQPAQHFGLGAVRDPDIDGNLVLALFALRVRNFHRGLLVLVVQDRAFRNLQHTLVFVQDDFRVGGHLSFELAARILD